MRCYLEDHRIVASKNQFMWLFFALLSSALWAVVHVLDSHFVQFRFERPWMGVTTSALASLIVFPMAIIVAPFFDWVIPSWQVACAAVVAGILLQLSQALYFQSLAHSEAGIVAAYWQLTPAMLPFVAFLLLKRVLGLGEYMGIAVTVTAAVWMCLLDGKVKARWRSFGLMSGAAALQVVVLLLLDWVYERIPYFEGFLLMTSGIVLCGILPLASSQVRSVFRRGRLMLRSSTRLIVGIEIVNLLAYAASSKAIQLGQPELVAAAEATMPGFCFLLSVAFLRLAPAFGDRETLNSLGWKLACVACMAIGVGLLK